MWALLEGWEPPAVAPDPALRARLEEEWREHGPEALHARLAALDPRSAERIDRRNRRRLIRALEIIEATGEPIAPLPHVPPPWPWRAVGLEWSRSALRRRADERAVRMYAAGLVEETRALVERCGEDFEALSSIGYAEALGVLHGRWDEAEAIGRTQAATRRLIRRQAAWFRPADRRIDWRDGRGSRGRRVRLSRRRSRSCAGRAARPYSGSPSGPSSAARAIASRARASIGGLTRPLRTSRK